MTCRVKERLFPGINASQKIQKHDQSLPNSMSRNSLSLSRDETHLKRVPSKQEGTFIPLKSVDYV